MLYEVITIRLTTQRQIILEELSKVTTHPTASELYDMVRKRLPRIGLGTVYRNLELMAESGMILKIEVGGTQKRFDATTDEHYHIRCSRCVITSYSIHYTKLYELVKCCTVPAG